jgi:hypothetical protein
MGKGYRCNGYARCISAAHTDRHRSNHSIAAIGLQIAVFQKH